VRGPFLTFAVIAAALAQPQLAGAATLLSPAEGETISSTPTFLWQLGGDEQSEAIEYSLNPAVGGGGRFADDRDKGFDLIPIGQTSYSVGNSQPLVAGTWYWHVRTSLPGEFGRD